MRRRISRGTITQAEWRALTKKKRRVGRQIEILCGSGSDEKYGSERDKWIRSQLRLIHRDRWQPKKLALRAARVTGGLYICAHCEKLKERSDVQVDHLRPCAGVDDPVPLDLFCALLFVPQSGYQVLCTLCHQAKTNDERASRRQWREMLELARLRLIEDLENVTASLALPGTC